MNEIQIALDSDNLELAEKLCDELLSENEYDANGLFYKGLVMRKRKDFQEAIDIQNSLINLMPGNAEYHAERGLTYHLSQEKELALADFNKAVELEPQNSYRYSSRAFVKDFYGDHQGAIADYSKAIELDPEDAIALNNLGVIEEKMGYLDKAKQNFDRSDQITGIDQQIKAATERRIEQNSTKEAVPSEKNLSFKDFFATLKGLFTSAEERRNFLRFLSGRK